MACKRQTSSDSTTFKVKIKIREGGKIGKQGDLFFFYYLQKNLLDQKARSVEEQSGGEGEGSGRGCTCHWCTVGMNKWG